MSDATEHIHFHALDDVFFANATTTSSLTMSIRLLPSMSRTENRKPVFFPLSASSWSSLDDAM